MRNLLLTIAIIVATFSSSSASVLLEFEIDGPLNSANPLPASNYASGVQNTTALSISCELTEVTELNYFLASDFNTGALDLDESYFTFTVTPETGQLLTFSSLDFTWANFSLEDPIITLSLRTSANGYASSLFTQTFTDYSENPISVDLSSLGVVDEAITFRLYGYNASATGAAGFSGPVATGSNVVLNGTAVPEPSAFLLTGFGILGWCLYRRK